LFGDVYDDFKGVLRPSFAHQLHAGFGKLEWILTTCECGQQVSHDAIDLAGLLYLLYFLSWFLTVTAASTLPAIPPDTSDSRGGGFLPCRDVLVYRGLRERYRVWSHLGTFLLSWLTILKPAAQSAVHVKAESMGSDGLIKSVGIVLVLVVSNCQLSIVHWNDRPHVILDGA